MSYTIAITGKGGTGKTTVAALVVSRLAARKKGPVLAVDADPNTCLDGVLGFEVRKTIGGVREEAREIAGKGMAAGISKQQLLEMKIAEAMVEGTDYDLIAMGRPEGPGCYCFANNVLKQTLEQVSSHYPYIVLDNEAGLENLSRRIVRKVDLMIMVADPSRRGLETVRRLHRLSSEMEIEYRRLVLVVNRVRSGGELSDSANDVGKELGADLLIGLPDNDEIAEFSENGRPLDEVSPENPVLERIDTMLGSVDL